MDVEQEEDQFGFPLPSLSEAVLALYYAQQEENRFLELFDLLFLLKLYIQEVELEMGHLFRKSYKR